MIKIINNFLPLDLLKKIQNKVFSQNFPWYWRDHLVSKGDHYWFNHCFYNNNQIMSPHYEDWILPIILKLKFKKLIEVRCNMMIKKNKTYSSNFHVDTLEKNAKTAILYLNTCNGGTVVLKNKKEKIFNSKENTMLIFDSSTLHRGFSQTDVERRVIININYC
jgi:hypothetical protein